MSTLELVAKLKADRRAALAAEKAELARLEAAARDADAARWSQDLARAAGAEGLPGLIDHLVSSGERRRSDYVTGWTREAVFRLQGHRDLTLTLLDTSGGWERLGLHASELPTWATTDGESRAVGCDTLADALIAAEKVPGEPIPF